MTGLAFSRTLVVEKPAPACDLLASLTGLPKGRIKDCMLKGGVWWHKPGRSATRLRRATSLIKPGEKLEINYDPFLLSIRPGQPQLVAREARYSVWNKPAGVLAQGTRFADHCSLPRLVRTLLGLSADAHPVHRLDREAQGLALLAHDGRAAAQLGDLFRSGAVDKEYRVIVSGIPDWEMQTSDQPLDGRPCRSHFKVLRTDPASATALLAAHIETGRKHQIRRHLAAMGHAVVGDTLYGPRQSRRQALGLWATSLALNCPFTSGRLNWNLPSPDFPVVLPEIHRDAPARSKPFLEIQGVLD